MKKKFWLAVALTAVALGANAQANDTLAKAKSSGKVVMGVRESSAPLSFTLGGGQFTGYHVELCQRILKSVLPGVPVEYVPVTSANRIRWCRTAPWTSSAVPPPTTKPARRTSPSPSPPT